MILVWTGGSASTTGKLDLYESMSNRKVLPDDIVEQFWRTENESSK